MRKQSSLVLCCLLLITNA